MENQEFRKYAHQLADWMADYLENIELRPVKSLVKPGDIFREFPDLPPSAGERMEEIIDDVNRIILPGITNWQSPDFFAYFPANSSYPSVLAEMMTAAIGAQCMVWETSPAAAELEEKVMNWLKEMTGIPSGFDGVIQDSASTSTLVAIITAREYKAGWKVNNRGFDKNIFTVYCSSEAHSSVEKAVKIAGIGKENLRKIELDRELSMLPEKLEEIIQKDIRAGFIPVCVIAAVGTTGTCAVDPVKAIAGICRKYDVWLHIDAAYAGSAMVLPQYRYMISGIEDADSYVFNPHKWMFTNFDCSAYFVKDKEALIKTFEILPEYLKTRPDSVVKNYRDWGIQLGRRFRALKLWFVIREMGVEGIQRKIADHISWTVELATQIRSARGFQLFEPQNLGLVCFRIIPRKIPDQEDMNALNLDFLYHLNSSGRLYLSHTKINGEVFLRMQIGQTSVTRNHVQKAWEFIKTEANHYI
jgi:aromatic-L-amino-acid/L-tryptophan decarboxylase